MSWMNRRRKRITREEIEQSLERLVQMGLCEKKVNENGETEYPFTEKGKRIADLIRSGAQGFHEMNEMFKQFYKGGDARQQ